jgi:hypothetical protein
MHRETKKPQASGMLPASSEQVNRAGGRGILAVLNRRLPEPPVNNQLLLFLQLPFMLVDSKQGIPGRNG